MKTTTIATGLLLAYAISAQAATVISYSEYFTNPGATTAADDKPLNTIGWSANYGVTATVHNVSSNNASVSPILSWVNFMFNNASSSAGTSSFVWIDGLSAGSATQFDSVRFTLQNESTAENIKIALQIGGAWYVTNTSYNNNVANITSATISTAGSSWNFLDFTYGVEMGIGSATSLPITGSITGVGIYDESRAARIRFDNLEIHTIPEPSAFVLLGAGAGLALLRRRR